MIRRAVYALLTSVHYALSGTAARVDRLADRVQDRARRVSPYGPAVAVRHPDGRTSMYAHHTPPHDFPLAG